MAKKLVILEKLTIFGHFEIIFVYMSNLTNIIKVRNLTFEVSLTVASLSHTVKKLKVESQSYTIK